MNEMFRQQTARQALADCIAAALAGTGSDTSLPALEAKLRALQEEQMRLFQLAVESGPENTEYDDRISEVNAAMAALLKRKGELEQADPAEDDSRVRAISDRLETADSSIGEFRDDTVRQLISSIKVLDKDRLSIRFKDGTEFEQIIESIGRASA